MLFDQVQTGSNSVGSVYFPQYLLQDYVAFEDFEQAASGIVRKIATGAVETIEFGLESFSEFNIKIEFLISIWFLYSNLMQIAGFKQSVVAA